MTDTLVVTGRSYRMAPPPAAEVEERLESTVGYTTTTADFLAACAAISHPTGGRP